MKRTFQVINVEKSYIYKCTWLGLLEIRVIFNLTLNHHKEVEIVLHVHVQCSYLNEAQCVGMLAHMTNSQKALSLFMKINNKTKQNVPKLQLETRLHTSIHILLLKSKSYILLSTEHFNFTALTSRNLSKWILFSLISIKSNADIKKCNQGYFEQLMNEIYG